MDTKRIVELAKQAAEDKLYAEENEFLGMPASPSVGGVDEFLKELETLLEAEKNSDSEITKRRIERAGQFLCYDNDEDTLAAIQAIEAQAEIDGYMPIDNVVFDFHGEQDRVLVWEPLVYKYSCDDFLEEIND
jgi:hypothetical protein